MLLLKRAPDLCTAKKKSFEARVKCARKNPGGTIFATKEAHSTHESSV